MKKIILMLALFSPLLFAETARPLLEIDLAEVSDENRPVVYIAPKFTIALMNGFCNSEETVVKATEKDVSENVDFYKKELPVLIEKFEALVHELDPDYFDRHPDFFPLRINLSLDGDDDCYNASAAANDIEVPVRADAEGQRAVFSLLYHEIGHTLANFNGSDQNLFDETMADTVSLLLFDRDGILYFQAAKHREELRSWLELGARDPRALAQELEIKDWAVPGWLKENTLHHRCGSDVYYRDMRNDFPLVDALIGGGESYLVSCGVHSYMRKLGKALGHEAVLKTFLQAYLKDPFQFNDINLPKVLAKVFPASPPDSFNYEVVKENIKLSLEDFSDDDGSHLKLRWIHPGLDLDWGVVAFKDTTGKPIASFSLLNGKKAAILTPKDAQTCSKERAVCYCPDKRSGVTVQLGWMSESGAKTQYEQLKLPKSELGCFELGVPESSARRKQR